MQRRTLEKKGERAQRDRKKQPGVGVGWGGRRHGKRLIVL